MGNLERIEKSRASAVQVDLFLLRPSAEGGAMPYLRKYFLLFSAAAMVFFAAREVQASVDYCQVIDVSGKAEILEADGIRWLPLEAPKFLKGGDKIRTQGKSYTEISTSPDFSGLLRLGVDSEAEVMGEDLARFFLRKGMLLILREEDSNVPGEHAREEMRFQIFTPDMAVSLLEGGCSVSVSEKGSWVRVFGEEVKAGPLRPLKNKPSLRVEEDFKYFISSRAGLGPLGPSRMYYSDYTDWQFWMKKCYALKDARAKDFLAKE